MDATPRNRRPSGRRHPPWSKLPVELLELVFLRPTLDSLDLLRCRDVCVSWRDVVLNLREHRHRVAFTRLLPCVLFLSGRRRTNKGEVYRLRLPDGEFYLESPQNPPWHCSYSHDGWLLMASGSTSTATHKNHLRKTFLHNPLTDILIPLPQCTNNFKYPFTFALSSRECSPGTIVCCYSLPEKRFAFYKIRQDYDDTERAGEDETLEWTPVQTVKKQYSGVVALDMTYHHGRFYAITNKTKSLLVLELEGQDYPPTVHVITLTTLPRHLPGGDRRHRRIIKSGLPTLSLYLVVLPAAGEIKDDRLLMVARYRPWKTFISKPNDNSSRRRKTYFFRVFCLQMETVTWKEVHDFGGGGLALFLNHNDSFFVQANDQAVCKQNSIYFVDDVTFRGYVWEAEEVPLTKYGKDMGVFDLETKKCEQFYNTPFNRWFVPTLSS